VNREPAKKSQVTMQAPSPATASSINRNRIA
jgi:hypothetical protein